MADYTFLDLIPHWADKEAEVAHHLGHPLLNPAGHVTISHIIFSSLVVLLSVGIGFAVRGKFTNRETAIVPEGGISLRNMVELILGSLFTMMADMMGTKKAKQFFPLIATLAFWILLSNLMGLVPGFAPPTSNLNTNIAPAIVVFLVYNIAGIVEHGPVAYLKHFLGPVLFIAPLMLVIELIGHAFRPLSLGIRLTGNMTGDHMVLGAFGDLATSMTGFPILLPLPFLALGLMVCVIQTLVFCLLSTVYIALAVEHAEH
ncbi:MAG: F0F1 ATP synthase subunit A [bacterium]